MSQRTALLVTRPFPPFRAYRRYSLVQSIALLARPVSTAATTQSLGRRAPFDKFGEGPAPLDTSERKFFRLSTSALIRSIILGKIFQTPLIFRPCLSVLSKIAQSKSPLFDANRNPLVRLVIYPLVYKHFCAGRSKAEVQKTIAEIKQCGYAGVILCYARETMARQDSLDKFMDEAARDEELTQKEVNYWKDGHLATLNTVGKGDYIGVKYTGAGPTIAQALKDGKELTDPMRQALYDICDKALAEEKRLWIDAEQQAYHPTIDKWTIELMRKYNRNGTVLVMTTIQAYLKSSRKTVEWYMRQAQVEGWTLGMKLVRGAYIGHDIRSCIHDTKADTDACYDGIAYDLLTKSWPGFDKKTFPAVRVFMAGHNVESIRKASVLAQELAASDSITEPVHYGQLQGMADDIGCEMLTFADRIRRRESTAPNEQLHAGGGGGGGDNDGAPAAELAAPRVYKCLTWGSVQECLHYLVRRAIENQRAAERLGQGQHLRDMRIELRRRLLRW